MEFVPFPKVPRLNREIVVTEKIDGTNASIYITDDDEGPEPLASTILSGTSTTLFLYAGSRTRWISPGDDNFGFAAWVQANADELFKLGPGHHFGEWWGRGIQRGYGLTERRFSLFNVDRWGPHNPDTPACCSVVPELIRGPFRTDAISTVIDLLRERGSYAAPGFMKPEGIIVWHTAARQSFKVTLEDDESPKSARS